MILQSLDFLHLNQEYNVTLQVAGSDQWGNITSGIDLIRKKTGNVAYGLTMPLVTDKYGHKFGKSEGNALWLDKEKTSPYKIYQYLINTDDSLVISYLKIFTFLTREEIEELEEITNREPEKRLAQKTLAYEVVKFIHGEEEALKAKEISEKAFTEGIFDEISTIEVTSNSLINVLCESNLVSSKSEARRLINQGGIMINNEKILDEEYVCPNEFILRKGKKNIFKIIIK
jgi:tyrosyl-tRNA synthetase